MNNVLFEEKDGIMFITINRPKALNALNSETIKELGEVVTCVEKRKDIKTVIITGSGEKSFVAGADIAEMHKLNAMQGRELALRAQKVFSQIEQMPQIVIAAVNGYALGGGCELSMACDLRIASEKAKFGQPEVNLGILPGFAGTQRLPRLVGKGIAKELIFTTDMIDAKRAYEIGLANKVVKHEELLTEAENIARKIMSKGMFGVSLAKAAINNGMNMDMESAYKYEADMFGLCFATDDQKEGMDAFLNKRKANFKDF
ncbi:Crotonyl-CoA hydratase [Fusobacterium sp. DD29]|uniref:enoyl-CoA hydratase-related protein n=1 Tax=unclassified Fusobacterium TaxID=2648384 RepID=UPI001B8B13F7|nr:MULTISPECIES: enoyl-CoA hydratase-related protein [unclassified Fusobacterium]MBR8701348.1 Crotonyl-CoA hydratase [Fusobacterium sp. DD45]MBR8711116.1 Crotonyl-CoA hydratase [Fusobacterium sp. DD28]MBR8749545.1 Crotonyl-CoA hydratase [Fusobacterium sp. DD29]MBR8752403.1 Crotonyl-CoA hydratase [Fusobacterium sp. DD26]MBR8761817.1 Crotonyl-CoA hydratase [Fusobacterium sp. DD25]